MASNKNANSSDQWIPISDALDFECDAARSGRGLGGRIISGALADLKCRHVEGRVRCRARPEKPYMAPVEMSPGSLLPYEFEEPGGLFSNTLVSEFGSYLFDVEILDAPSVSDDGRKNCNTETQAEIPKRVGGRPITNNFAQGVSVVVRKLTDGALHQKNSRSFCKWVASASQELRGDGTSVRSDHVTKYLLHRIPKLLNRFGIPEADGWDGAYEDFYPSADDANPELQAVFDEALVMFADAGFQVTECRDPLWFMNQILEEKGLNYPALQVTHWYFERGPELLGDVKSAGNKA